MKIKTNFILQKLNFQSKGFELITIIKAYKGNKQNPNNQSKHGHFLKYGKSH